MPVEIVEVGEPGKTYSVELSEAEIAMQIIESMSGQPRLRGMSAEDALDDMHAVDPASAELLRDAARAVLAYLIEAFRGARVKK